MHSEAASSSSDLTSESSSDDEEYLQQVPMDKMRIVKSYRRVKTQLISLKRKKKMLLIQEKVVKEEKSLLKNLLLRSLETTNKHISSKHSTYIKQVETSEYKYDETDLLIQIQREEQHNKALSLKNTIHNIKTEIIPDENIKCHNFGDTGNQAQDLHNKDVMQPAFNVVQTEKNNMNANLNDTSSNNPQLDKSVDQPGETKSQIDENTDQAGMKYLQKSKKRKRKCTPKQGNGEVIYKMIDVENGYYIKISKPARIKYKYFIPCKKLLRAMKPIINEFADFISPELFMYVTRKVIEKEITDLLVGKEKMKARAILDMFREKYPEAKDGFYVISNLVAIWRGDYNDPPDSNDNFNKLIAERDPQKLVSYEDIWNGKTVWEIIKILPEEKPKTNEKKEQTVNSSVSTKTDLDDSCCESATESKEKCDIDSSFVIDDGENIQRNKKEITVPWIHKIEQEDETTDISHAKNTLKRSNEANSEKEDPHLDNVIKRLCTEEVEIPIKQEIHAQATNEAVGTEKELKPTEIIETNKIHTNVKQLLDENCSK